MRSTPRPSGYTLAELLVVMVVIAFIAAIAIPIFLNQRSNALNTAIRSDLGLVSATLNTQLLLWDGEPPNGALAICHGSATYPIDPEPENTCTPGSWSATLAADGTPLTPAVGGFLSNNVSIQGFIDEDGDYCLDGFAEETDSRYYITSNDDITRVGTCAGGSWVNASPNPSPSITAASPIPGAPAGMYVTTTTSSATVHWNATAGETYAVSISGQPVRTITATATEQMTCIFPSEGCDATAATGTLSAGTYVASVRVQGTQAWGPAANAEFGIPVTVTATPTVTVTVTETPTPTPDPTDTASPSPSESAPPPSPSPSPSP